MNIFNKKIYLDYASLTPIDKGVLDIVNKYSGIEYGNPDSIHSSGVKAKKVLNGAKEIIVNTIHAHPDEILFTSGGTESNKLILEYFENKKVIISSIEHSSIIKNVDAVKINVDKNGLLDLEELKKSLTTDTALVSIIMVNNEIGTIQSIHEISKIIRDFNKKNNSNILLHTDACQAFVHNDIYVEKLGIDLMTLDSHKVYGPRGVGMLYVKRGSIKIERAGTANIPGIMGFVHALQMIEKNRADETKRISEFKKYFIDEILKIRKDIKINGVIENTSPHILNIQIPGIDNEFFLLQLDSEGIEISTKSACLQDEDESYVLKAIGASSKESVRFSFGRYTKMSDIRRVIRIIKEILVK
jgi:cysteine desulfurase